MTVTGIIKSIFISLLNVLIDFAKTVGIVTLICAFTPMVVSFSTVAIVWACTYFVKIYCCFKTSMGIDITLLKIIRKSI